MLVHTSVFLNLCAVKVSRCAAKDFKKNYLGTSNIACCRREICKIRSENHFYLERIDFGKEMTRESANSGEDLFFFLDNSLLLWQNRGKQSG